MARCAPAGHARDAGGYLGVEVVRPAPGGREYVSVVRFASLDALSSWEQSDARREWTARLPPEVVEGDADVRRLEGMEAWFTASGVAAPVAPTRWKMALVLVFVVYGLILGIGPIVGAVVGDVAYPLRLLLTVVVEVALMTWVVMPTITRVLGRWLFAR